MTQERQFYFDVDTVASYLYHINPSISPLKLQKGLYFLFAYHGALYGEKVEDGVFEGTIGMPKYLFDAEFEAWQYGPVIRYVYFSDRDGDYVADNKPEKAKFEIEKEPEVKKFIDELFEQIDSVSDFKLVDRSHQDEAWKSAYKKGQSTPMNNELIIQEYREQYV
ncbi:type II toxin-antitoxin system antitoxin SocA domain-containing protein [Paenibacillus sp. FSL H3-0457]|uniref:Panacea domain-containing protein n=1 Tax=Paenibacillus sp. FSL H3-0457 TaxID=2921430 RepID=UPI0030EEC471